MSERWLIVVNGKTELNYVTALRQRFRSSNIEVKHVEKDPLGQVLEARTHMRRGKYARIYVVFDTDNFAYDKAISMIHDLTNEKSTCTWHVVVSRPCFELWVLLHSIYTNAEFAGNTPCNDLRARFSKEFAKYSKVDQKITKDLTDNKLETAESNGKKLDKDPSSSKTDMWKLVDALRTKAQS